MKKTLLAAGTVLVLAVAIAAQGVVPDFSGTWALDAAKSDFGPVPPPESIVMVIDHKEPALKSTVTQKGAQGGATVESNITTDGKENVNTMRVGPDEQSVKSTSKWIGKTLATTRTLEAQGMSIGIDDSWELSADGKVMTILRQLRTPQGDFAMKTVFNKQ